MIEKVAPCSGCEKQVRTTIDDRDAIRQVAEPCFEASDRDRDCLSDVGGVSCDPRSFDQLLIMHVEFGTAQFPYVHKFAAFLRLWCRFSRGC